MPRKRSWSASLTNIFSTSSSAANSDQGRHNRHNDAGYSAGSRRRDTIASTPDPNSSPGDPLPQMSSRNSSRPTSRPLSMIHMYNQPTPQIAPDEKPELMPIFNFLNIHSQKLYTEGYFLKLVDMTPDGKHGNDRSWKECFGQLRGCVLSMWDAAELDAAEQTGEEVMPTFLNLTDASIRMIDSLPTRAKDTPPLTNVLSISTAGYNRYLIHCNSHHSLSQWTASIRLCMFEQAKLQEIYTGAIIAAKGKDLNGIGQITERTRFQYEDWVRVRFGAGMPWRKCWAVITQPDEKARKKAKAAAKKAKKSAYANIPVLKGEIKFFETKKTKKQKPIASVVDCYSAYAVYPQSRALIEHSTLIKLEGKVRIHAEHTIESEGIVFIMPDIHPMVSGFETMLRFLFPTWDTFALYGRPGMLIPDKLDLRSLMFAMPRDGGKECGYLDVVDVVSIILQDGAKLKQESEWRARLKKATEDKIKMIQATGNMKGARSSLPAVGKGGHVVFHNGKFPSAVSLDQDLPPHHVPFDTPPGSRDGKRSSRPLSDMSGYPSFKRPITPPLIGGVDQRSSPQRNGNPPGTGSSSGSGDSYFPNGVDPATVRLGQTLQPDVQPVPVTPRTTHAPSARPNQPLPQPSNIAAYDEDNLFAGVVPLRQSLISEARSSAISCPLSHESRDSWGSHQIQTATPLVLRGPPPPRDVGSRADYEYPPVQSQSNTPSYRGSHEDVIGGGYPNGGSLQSTPEKSSPARGPIARKPVPGHLAMDERADSLSSLQNHLIDQQAMEKIPTRSNSKLAGISRRVTDEDDFDRRAKERRQNGGYESQSDYEDDEPDYASVISEPPKVERDAERPRTGRMKIVGKEEEKDVIIGDVHYRPKSPGNLLKDTIAMPVIDFGKTINHGRSLSTELDHDDRRSSSSQGFYNQGSSRNSSNVGWTPSSDLGQQQPQRRSMVWQPGMAHLGGQEPGLSPEQFVAERAAAAQANTRQRYVHHRKSSSGMLSNTAWHGSSSHEHLPPRPHSRGGNSAFTPGGLMSEINAPLSAKQQEYVARSTGTSLVQLQPEERAPPPHNTGLLGAIQAQEEEKKRMKEEFQSGYISRDAISPSVQQEIARRQLSNAREATKGRTTPSPRPLSNLGGSYFSQHNPQQLHQQQQAQYPHVTRSKSPLQPPQAISGNTGFPHVLRSAPPTRPMTRSPAPSTPGSQAPPPPAMQYYTPQQMGVGDSQGRNGGRRVFQSKRRSGFF
ncbi:hypothetical protein EX30DRAFT_365148 [Ascodesmis nigricans]|uniref:PH domain-containing protein n=1 Tax=Ascodesmis nigricans TaxID=341454 RepID=A0A4S2MT17_9PEZI|nr:hypothetical protein EX30DRAFT_365148 [Ascodesmis nigricans]